MPGKHRAVIVGAGRIGAGWNWNDDPYTHAGAYRALKDRVELMGFVEPDTQRGEAAFKKWGIPWAKTINYFSDFDIVSVCTQPEQRADVFASLPPSVKGVWCEKPYGMTALPPAELAVQVNYQRRGDPIHQEIASKPHHFRTLVVYGKDDETTRCHFRDLAKWWGAKLVYRPFTGPCAYILDYGNGARLFDGGTGGVDSAECFKAMLGNLLDHLDNGTPLWSPPYVE